MSSNTTPEKPHQHRGQRHSHKNRSETASHDITLSKGLSYLLRHGAPKENVTIHPGGFIDVDEILKLRKFHRYSISDIKSVVEENDKQRFTLRIDAATEKLQICANQGHSFPVEDLELEPIIDPSVVPVIIHGTYFKYWESIRKVGLKRMNRIHIHFAPGEPGKEGVISGMRNSAEIYIYVDIHKALKDGIKFFRSRNNVILSPGNALGILETKYFEKVKNVKTNEILNVKL